MSRLAKKLVYYPESVQVVYNNAILQVSSGDARLERAIDPLVSIEIDSHNRSIQVKPSEQATAMKKSDTARLGLTWALTKNMITGVSVGFRTAMTLVGVGYKVEPSDTGIRLFLGYSHPIEIARPDGIQFEIQSPTAFSVCGIDNQRVGQVAADIRQLRKPDAYKGKGVRYATETIRLKAGKSVK